MTRSAQNLLLVLLGAAILWITVVTDEYLNYVRPGFRYVLVPAALVLIALGAAGLRREWRQPVPDEPPGCGPPGTAAAEKPDEADKTGGKADEEPGTAAGTAARGGAGHAAPDALDAADALAGGHSHAGGHGPRVAWLLCLPAAAIFLVAPPALGSFTAARDAGRPQAPPPAPAEGYRPLPVGGAPAAMTMAEFISRSFAAQTGDPATLTDRPVRLVGFVTPRKEGGWFLSRLRINCCAGDALPLQVVVRDQDRPKIDSWVEVVGTWTPPPDRRHVVYELQARSVRPIKKPKNAYEG